MWQKGGGVLQSTMNNQRDRRCLFTYILWLPEKLCIFYLDYSISSTRNGSSGRHPHHLTWHYCMSGLQTQTYFNTYVFPFKLHLTMVLLFKIIGRNKHTYNDCNSAVNEHPIEKWYHKRSPSLNVSTQYNCNPIFFNKDISQQPDMNYKYREHHFVVRRTLSPSQ